MVVNTGSTSDSVAMTISAASAEVAPSRRKLCTWCFRPPAITHRPTAPLQTIMIAAKIVSRGRPDLSLPPASIIETISATSITVTETARISVPNGSPTRCATTSA